MQAIPIPRRRTTHDATSTSLHPSPPYRNPTDPAATTAANRRHLDIATPALTLPQTHRPRHHYNPRHLNSPHPPPLAASSPSPQPPQPLPLDVATTTLTLLQVRRPRRHLDIATPIRMSWELGAAAPTPPTPQPTSPTPPQPPPPYPQATHLAAASTPSHRTLQQAHHTCSHPALVSILLL